MKKIQTRLVVGVLALATLTCAVAAQNNSASQKAAQARDLTSAISGTLRSQNKGRFDENFRRMAAERKALLSELAESDAAAVLQNSLPAEALSRMPADLAPLFERHGTFSGELVIEAECEEHDSRTHRYIRSGEDSKQLYLDAEPTMELKTGDQVAVTGVAIDDKVVASAEQTTVTASSTSLSATGEKRVLVILVNFQDKATQPFTVEHARDVAFTQTSNFMRENSYGQTWLTGDVYGWYTIPVSSTVCDKNAIATNAKQAAVNAGVNLAGYTNIVYGFPSNACTFAGSSTVGGYPSQSWVNHFFTLSTLGHELGHGFGLFHSRTLDCGTASIGANCTTSEYGNVFDIMGGGAIAHTNVYQKERLGWVNQAGSPPLMTVTSGGTYWLGAYETASPDTKGLKILKSIDPISGLRTWYYVEHRTPTGFDSSLANPNYNVTNGVSVHVGAESSGAENYLLDMTPATSTWYDPALLPGSSFTDPETGLTITTLSVDGSGAWVRVDMAAQACVRANPTVSVTPGQSNWLSAGSTYIYTVSVRNNNSGGCANETFNLSAGAPNGLAATFSNGAASLANGATVSREVYVSSSTGMTDGVYRVGVAATSSANPAYSAAGSASYVLVSRLGMTLAAGSAKYSRNQIASVKANVSAAGSPVAGASVIFTMTKPNGATVSQTATTGADGNATFSYRFDRKRDLTGTYTVRSASTVNGYSGQASTSFLVNR